MLHHKIQFIPDNRVVTVHSGATLLEAAGEAGIILASPCGGAGRCGKCRVQILPSGKNVLACQYVIEHDLVVKVPEQSRLLHQQVLQHGIGRTMPIEPSVRKVFVRDPWEGVEAFCRTLSEHIHLCLHIEGPVERELEKLASEPAALSGITAVLFPTVSESHTQDSSHPCFRLAAAEAGDTTHQLFGASVDIGTTTVVVNLVDLKTGTVVATASDRNPQARYGADVISRIHFASGKENGLILQQAIVECLDELIGQAAAVANVPRTSIYEIVAAGNTTMNHLLLNLPVVQLGQAPYHAYSLLAYDRNAAAMNLNIHPAGQLHTIENIAGFVGSDTLAGALAGGMESSEGPTLLVDIGTNGELVLAADGKLWAASCAAGPALEGAGIEFGSPAQDGSIQRVLVAENDIEIDVIGGNNAQTICGSGLIDAVAVLLELGIVDETGRFAEPETIFPPLAKMIAQRLCEYQGQPAFRLSDADASALVVLTQKDVRQFQLAKAAIRAGIQLLCQEASLPEEKIGRILLAGAFGNYIQRQSAVRVGLLPGPGIERIRFVGNTAGAGATMILISRHARNIAAQLAHRIQYVEIAHHARFHDAFSDCLMFPVGQ